MTNIAIENDPFIVSFPIKHETCSIAVAFCKRLPEGTPQFTGNKAVTVWWLSPSRDIPEFFRIPNIGNTQMLKKLPGLGNVYSLRTWTWPIDSSLIYAEKMVDLSTVM